MSGNSTGLSIFISAILLSLVTIGGSMFLPSWGKLNLSPAPSVTVVGEARSQEKSQIANFSAGVAAYSDDKTTAVNDVNSKVDAIIEAVKQFGVSAQDIKTASLNIYQNQEQYYEDGRQKFRPGQWNVSNTVEIKLHDVDRASSLANLLTQSGATNVYGPNFTLDDTSEQATALIDAAFTNAREKAFKIAETAGRDLGKVVSISEGTQAQAMPIYRTEGGGGGAAVEPGSGTVSKTITVTFELK